jgi:hypothetical protein
MVARKAAYGAAAWTLLMLAVVTGSEVNIVLDATTAATRGYNQFEGSVAYLTDGLHPGNSDVAEAFVWPNKGSLTFQFEEPRQISGLRVYVGGNGGAYQATGFLGAFMGDDGQTDASQAVVAADTVNFDFAENAWAELPFPPETVLDYIELSTESGAEFYEVEILHGVADGSTAVEQTSWGATKARAR